MLTREENELLTRIGPGTPMGALMRRYWHPLAAVEHMRGRWTKRVRILGEDLVLYRDRSGTLGLIGEFCPHRRASLAYGIPTDDGIRCPYHGWKFDGAGRCLEQPNEPEASNFKDKVSLPGYPVQELAGMIWAYLGPAPAPLLPRFDGLVAEPAIRVIATTRIACNWLQIMENSVDPIHTEWLHGKLFEFVNEKNGITTAMSRHHAKIAFDEFEHGLIKRRLMVGQSEDAADWRVGHPLVFPNMLAVSSGEPNWTYYFLQYRVPIDDTTTEHFWYNAFTFPPGTEIPDHLLERATCFEAPQRDESGEYPLQQVHAQDAMAWETQGPIAERDLESLGTTDRGLIVYRQMLLRELAKVQRGEDPVGVIRDPAANGVITLPMELGTAMNDEGFETVVRRNVVGLSPVCDEIVDVWRRSRLQRQGARA
jgi:5,5'-dehydrodivanillate O-demethylase oxygenase subunit